MSKQPHTHRIDSISELHRLMGLPRPKHPLISLVDNEQLNGHQPDTITSISLQFYGLSYKEAVDGKMGYGQGYYDFDEGGMIFTGPNQIIGTYERHASHRGKTIFFHPDLLFGHPLGKSISRYGFFDYQLYEALHVSESEKAILLGLFANIEAELSTSIDEMSQDVLVSYLEVVLSYSQRFYKRQFITRKAVNHELLTRMEQLLNTYFNQQQPLQHGLPTVEYLAGQLHLSPRYLSDMLRSLTGQNAQQHIHEKLIAKAKEYLSTTTLSVAEIAYELGFERPQSFNKLFKKKLNLSPLEFRSSFN
ncbi:helix-turn-helix domain-containing protein [Hymenobacter metallicola]|uniref:AraC family transcriptional regulator n=1 Tax=Hymenobacter metallicola TaxID=2563114 RepID=A0A4Z0PYA4_9BACT|nr:helix-turn-helix transcriptional regulator [Hymenobacter metallicola]TGE22748.1 AraC family transcriptional regulator [Hymenobacter metallicola]